MNFDKCMQPCNQHSNRCGEYSIAAECFLIFLSIATLFLFLQFAFFLLLLLVLNSLLYESTICSYIFQLMEIWTFWIGIINETKINKLLCVCVQMFSFWKGKCHGVESTGLQDTCIVEFMRHGYFSKMNVIFYTAPAICKGSNCSPCLTVFAVDSLNFSYSSDVSHYSFNLLCSDD